ncbi:hypothetical protein [Kitasatospora sp. NPDC057738]|uniref:hypothetical protein n=1 Tax=Kitasatospora sp. NPDC057738 TaxID=3346233 RepID=UPI00367A9BA5
MTTWFPLAACSPLVLWWACRIATARRTPMPHLPDDIGIQPATDGRPAILWARYGHTVHLSAVPDTQTDHEEDPS